MKDEGAEGAAAVAPASKTYDAPGPGRKQCVECRVYCGVRSAMCPACGFDFRIEAERRKAERAAAERAEAEARKAARAAQEQAQSQGAIQEAKTNVRAFLVGGGAEGAADSGRRIVLAHEGPSPVSPPQELSEDALRVWAAACVAARPSVYLTVESLLLWLRPWSWGSSGYVEARRVLSTVPGVVVFEEAPCRL